MAPQNNIRESIDCSLIPFKIRQVLSAEPPRCTLTFNFLPHKVILIKTTLTGAKIDLYYSWAISWLMLFNICCEHSPSSLGSNLHFFSISLLVNCTLWSTKQLPKATKLGKCLFETIAGMI